MCNRLRNGAEDVDGLPAASHTHKVLLDDYITVSPVLTSSVIISGDLFLET